MSSPLCHLQYTTLFERGIDFLLISFEKLASQRNHWTVTDRNPARLGELLKPADDIGAAGYHALVMLQTVILFFVSCHR